MIKSRDELNRFYLADKIALKEHAYAPKWRNLIFGEGDIYHFQLLLRKVEYYHNKNKNIFEKIFLSYLYRKYIKKSQLLGFTIPLNVISQGLSIAHRGYIVINPEARIGVNCRIHPGVVIGEKHGKSPKIGDNVYIGPGAKIFGGVTIANGVKIGANAVVNKSIIEENVTVVGIPAQVIKK
ncbi:hypothetical protein J1N10_18900 [Carboxylicivirga sp. A043]|uniref:serine O-acetyltransferase n=1 Tax=Carboxylicivirga litoralis TaxID=2816963 RepID=UPI0021CB2A08|nr:hypothetical protein [Carboxylicivirga sp. A043]MCU4158051.1 hypothetical protein [Carboxylicivirga sp. A043]